MAATSYVGPGQSYTTIQGAITAASPGDTIYVIGGEYHEIINANKPITLIGIANGAGSLPVIDGAGLGENGVNITAGGVTMEGFTIRGDNDAGIRINGSNVVLKDITIDSSIGMVGIRGDGYKDITVRNCNISGRMWAVYLESGEGCDLYDLDVQDNFGGVAAIQADDTEIVRCNFENNTEINIAAVTLADKLVIRDCRMYNTTGYGVYTIMASNITVENVAMDSVDVGVVSFLCNDTSYSGLTITDCMGGMLSQLGHSSRISNCEISGNNSGFGVQIVQVNDLVIEGLTINAMENNFVLIESNDSTITNMALTGSEMVNCVLVACNDISILDSTITGSHESGLDVNRCDQVLLSGLNVSDNMAGVMIEDSTNVTLSRSRIADNENYGLSLQDTVNATVVQNSFINNTLVNAQNLSSANVNWNTTAPARYVYRGLIFTNCTGNYWSDYTGNDTNSDGIGDVPYINDSGVIDYYPLIKQSGSYDFSGQLPYVIGAGTVDMSAFYSKATPSATPIVTPTATITPTPQTSATPIATPIATPTTTPTPTQVPGPQGGNNLLYIVLGLLALVVVGGVAAYLLFLRK